jgi:hypothetical protein
MRSSGLHASLSVPVFIYGYDHSGKPFKEITRTLMVSAEGGFVELAAPVATEHPALLINMATARCISCYITSTHMGASGKAHVGIHFALSSPRFWEIEFPAKVPQRVTRRRQALAVA